MPFCRPVRCASALTSMTLGISGSGNAGDGWMIRGWEAICTEFPDTRPAGSELRRGVRVWTVDTERYMVWDGAEWIILTEPPQPWDPIVAGVLLGERDEAESEGITQFTYMRNGMCCEFDGTIVLGAGGKILSAVTVELPFPGDPAQEAYVGECTLYRSAGDQNYSGVAELFYTDAPGDLTLMNVLYGNGDSRLTNTNPFTWTQGDAIRFHLAYAMKRATP